MISSVSKLADKNFIVGFFVPALVLLFGLVSLFSGVPWISELNDKISSDKTLTDLAYLAFGVWLLALLLMICNYTFYRILEGYAFPLSSMTSMFRRHRLKRLELYRRKAAFVRKRDAVAASRISWRLNQDYPAMQYDVLPTLFGNRIRAFERYSNELYGADGVTIWPRLLTVITAEYGTAIGDAQAQVNCMMNLCFIALTLSVAALIRLLFEALTQSGPDPSDVPKLIAALLIGPCAAYGAYVLATERVIGWGESVKSAYDCFLPRLATQLGYAAPVPESRRKLFWDAISQLFLYHQPLADAQWPASTAKQKEESK